MAEGHTSLCSLFPTVCRHCSPTEYLPTQLGSLVINEQPHSWGLRLQMGPIEKGCCHRLSSGGHQAASRRTEGIGYAVSALWYTPKSDTIHRSGSVIPIVTHPQGAMGAGLQGKDVASCYRWKQTGVGLTAGLVYQRMTTQEGDSVAELRPDASWPQMVSEGRQSVAESIEILTWASEWSKSVYEILGVCLHPDLWTEYS